MCSIPIMLIPDLFNFLIDQSDYVSLVMMCALNKRKTNYANKYSLAKYYHNVGKQFINGIYNVQRLCYRGKLKIIKLLASNMSKYELDRCLVWTIEKLNMFNITAIYFNADLAMHFDDRRENNINHMELVKYLVSIGVDIHYSFDSATWMSATINSLQLVKYFVSIGANLQEVFDWIPSIKYHYDNRILKYNDQPFEHNESCKYLLDLQTNNNEVLVSSAI